VFAKFRKATIGLAMSVVLSIGLPVRRERNGIPLDRFSLNLLFKV